ncbi:hypothetical protein H4R33_006452 [Dimargaris cristalligena]|uniref:Inositol-pentakisphosphate 2-kinase n=1 Tax=Dimargaris cristalligena TaxID=215637 RepID=A0A4P9ZNE4_9FUNG|nr:hypothetical protein H4R33_006452 [Dimargaris cristalligena]RKP34803.1 inositol-pentakisphosphate 2-kinase [Dimargaris cristalligena]|eukprot:RKP34803.1 inositol-pentakisphosphate 2-kinase [Dimargaris cristalligena]
MSASPTPSFCVSLPPREVILDPSFWRYKNEGNANIIFSSVSSIPAYQGLALRVRKSGSRSLEVPSSKPNQANSYQTVLTYIESTIIPLVGSEYTAPMCLQEVTPQFLTELDEQTSSYRPDYRLHKGIDSSYVHAMVTIDLTYSPKSPSSNPSISTAETGLSVEIKPKWGFLSNSVALPQDHIKRKTCRFCMKKYLDRHRDQYKSRPGAILPLTEFCPMDLYSPNSERVERALETLYRNPRNNMRLFNGDGYLTTPPSWNQQVLRFFQKHVPSSIVNEADSKLHLTSILESHLTPVLVGILLKEPILRRIQRWQQRLDQWDIEALYPLVRDFMVDPSNGPLKDRLLTLPTSDEWAYAAEQALLDSRKQQPDYINPNAHSLRQAIVEYLISATLKDCSIFISLWFPPADDTTTTTEPPQHHTGQLIFSWDTVSNRAIVTDATTTAGPSTPLAAGNPDHHLAGGTELWYSIHAIDLDPKPISKFEKYFGGDQNIVNYYKSLNLTRVCQAD